MSNKRFNSDSNPNAKEKSVEKKGGEDIQESGKAEKKVAKFVETQNPCANVPSLGKVKGAE